MTKLRHCYPLNFRPAKVFERRRYYSRLDFGLMEKWFREKPEELRRPVFHLDVGNETRYYKREYQSKLGKLLYFNIKDFQELKEMVLEYLPEDLYYDRNVYKDVEKCADCEKRGKGCLSCDEVLGQELMFDVDPENIDCPNCGSLDDRGKGASMFKFCYICFNRARDQTVELYKWLESKGYGRLSTVYSGRGFHIYVEDDKAYRMSYAERKKLAGEVKGMRIAIDPWVTEGGSRLARVPYSLNGLVSRVCHPIEIGEIKKLDFWRSRTFVPDFI
jgi:DNA primase catalytic subunit